jgi:hypothetical protein
VRLEHLQLLAVGLAIGAQRADLVAQRAQLTVDRGRLVRGRTRRMRGQQDQGCRNRTPQGRSPEKTWKNR